MEGPSCDVRSRPPARRLGRKKPRARAILLCAALLSGCAPGRDLAGTPPPASTDYRLGAGDTLRIITYGEDPLTGEFRVNDQGAIALPLAGTVKAAGRTPHELEEAVAAALKKGDMLRKPSVSVEVAAYRPNMSWARSTSLVSPPGNPA